MKKHMMTVLLVLLMMVFPATVFADDAGSVSYDGEELVSNFKTIDVSDLQPGDSQEYTITVKNDGKEKTDWWLSNKVIKTLEENSKASGGAYTYELKYNNEVIYSNDTVGGDEKTSGGGLHEATDAMEQFFHFATLDPGKSGVVTLKVALDGESQGNAYQNTTGELELIFAVEPYVEGEPTPPAPTPAPKTGDDSNMLPYYIVAFGAGALLLLLALGRMKKSRKEDGANE